MKKNEVIEYRILLIGDTNSNKTKIFNKIIKISTIWEAETKIITYKNKKYLITLQDTAGQERFRSIIKSYIHMGDGFFIVFNL